MNKTETYESTSTTSTAAPAEGSVPRAEYPRPDFVRASYFCLNGTWKFDFDDEDKGQAEKWQKGHDYSKKITVPFAYQTSLSGIGDTSFHDVIWYEREFEAPDMEADEELLLHFGAIDYIADIYLNGELAAHHEGGDSPIHINATHYLTEGVQRLTVRAYDPGADETIPRGKQFWEEHEYGIWYTGTSGIWQPVWMEVVNKCRLEKVRMTTHFEEGCEEIKVISAGDCRGLTVCAHITLGNEVIGDLSSTFVSNEVVLLLDVVQKHIFRTSFHHNGRTWTPETPQLYDVSLTLTDGEKVLDQVSTYFGFRKVHIENGMIYLNNRPYYQRLVLDQGYWPESLLTAPSDEALKFDIEAAKKLGFNGCRKHQKAEDPRFLYWADRLGFLVYGECASVPTFGEDQMRREMHLWSEILDRDMNHPSIVAWVPINESWGVPNIHLDPREQHYTQTLYHYLHACDNTRLVISNDGWELTETDICAIHNYEQGNDDEKEKREAFSHMFDSREEMINHPCGHFDIYARGFSDKGVPIVVTEFGGIGFDVKKSDGGWGYTNVNSAEHFIKEYDRVVSTVIDSPVVAGFCYTQLTDVEQGVNGLLTYDRQFKCDPEEIKKINCKYRRMRVTP